MDRLNYHHLRYFHAVATEGHLGQAAKRLNLSQSALSIQIKQLEERLGHALFDRVGRRLQITEAGRIALAHADRIFGAGRELLATLEQTGTEHPTIRVGALSTLSRNFQLGFLRPLLAAEDYPLILKSGGHARLLQDLEEMALDVVLSTEIPSSRPGTRFAAQRMAQQEVQLHGIPERLRHESLEALLRHEPLILPTESTVRAGFERLVSRLGITPRVAADVDDMAMVRLLTREGTGVAVAPSVVLADEIAGGRVATAPFDLGIVEPFYAITLPRQFPHPGLADLLSPRSGHDSAQPP